MSVVIIPSTPLPVRLGDLIFTYWPGFVPSITMKITGGGAAHQEQICCDGDVPMTITASKAMNSMKVWEWGSRKDYFTNTKTEWCRFTAVPGFDAVERMTLHNYFEEARNTYQYSRAELVLQAADSFKNWLTRAPYDSERAVFFRKAGDLIKDSVICSKAANAGLVRVNRLPAWAVYWSPADTLNKVMSSTSWRLAEATPKFFKDSVVKPPTMDPRALEVLIANGVRV